MKKTTSLKKNYEFMRVYKRGKYFVGKFITLYTLPNRSSSNRLGITTSKKVGKSVRRNRLRRLIKENYRFYEDFVKEGFDIIFVARDNEILPDFFDIKKEMKYLFKKLNIFNQEKWNCSKEFL